MHGLANGIDITGAALALALGNKPNVTAVRNDPCAVLELFPKTPGVFIGIKNLEELKALPSLTYLSVKATLSTFTGKAADGYKMAAVVMLHNQDHSQFQQDLDFIAASVAVETK
ncbi:hypothetical protein D3C85_1084420 [compost metagenome]